MGSWTNFYINTSDAKTVVETIADLTDNLEINYDVKFPEDMGEYYLYDLDLAPNYIAIGNTQPYWTTVAHNSFDKMEDWGELLSGKFSSKVIVSIAQSVSSSYYFALYENGVKLREIETCYSEDFDEVNYGKKFDFEGAQPGHKSEWKEGEEYSFGFNDIEEYCGHFNLVIQTDYDDVQWAVLKARHLQKEDVMDYLKRIAVKKPWWKFW